MAPAGLLSTSHPASSLLSAEIADICQDAWLRFSCPNIQGESQGGEGLCSQKTSGSKPHRDPFPGPRLQIHWRPGSTQISASLSLQQGLLHLTGRQESHPYNHSHQASDNTLVSPHVKPEGRTCLEKKERGIHPRATGARGCAQQRAEQPVLRAKG